MSSQVITPEHLAKRKQCWVDFLAPTARPGFVFIIRYTDTEADLPQPVPYWPEKKAERIEFIWQMYQHHLSQAAWLDDDFIPHLSMTTGTEIFAEAFGCRVVKSPDTNPFAQPLIHTADEVACLRVPELSRSSLAYLFEMADELQRRAGPDALFRLVDIQSPLDIAALIWEKSAFFAAMIDAPEAVHELAVKAAELLTTFIDEWFNRYGTSYIAHHPDYYMSGGITLSEDEIGAVSPAMFTEFFLPRLNALSARYGGIGIHCCADARHQWPGLKSVTGLRLLNLGKPHHRQVEDYIIPAYAYFAEHCAQWHTGWALKRPYATLPAQFPAGSRVVLEVQAKTRAEAVETSRILRNMSDTTA